jgi:glycyl-tRNA synthetase
MEKAINIKKLLDQKPFFQDLVKSRFLFAPSFEIYGGTKGLYDYGPVGCAIKNNMFARWRDHFILEDDMLEISCSNLTPYQVLKNSGHVDRFTDLMCKDLETKEPYRADHVLEDFIDGKLKDDKTSAELKAELELLRPRAEDLNAEEMAAVFVKYSIKSPDTGNELSAPAPFNLMFATQLGPWADGVAYLRPETAQSLITNFKKLLAFNNGKLPFAAANIGLGFRNEIAPKKQLLRVREFDMGEIEHFLDPLNKDHVKYDLVKHIVVPLFKGQDQLDNKQPVEMSLEEAINTGMLYNQTMAYFIGRTYQFMEKIGIDVNGGIRFRQHKENEKAHYAEDCWDCELLTSYGWVECVGIADRSAYDLTAHSNGIGKPLNASRRLTEPKQEERIKLILDKGALAKELKANAKFVFEHMDAFDNDELTSFKNKVEAGEEFTFENAG